MPNYVRHAPGTFEQMGSTIANCPSIEEAANRAFRNKRFTDSVAFIRETNGRTVNAYMHVQNDDGSMSSRKLESFQLGRKSGGRVPLHTVPPLFLKSTPEIFKYYTTANRVVDAVVNRTPAPTKRRVVRTTTSSTKKLETPSVASSTGSGFLDSLTYAEQTKLLTLLRQQIESEPSPTYKRRDAPTYASKYLCV